MILFERYAKIQNWTGKIEKAQTYPDSHTSNENEQTNHVVDDDDEEEEEVFSREKNSS